MWQDLFIKALKALDASRVPGDEWTFGGGTALTVYFQHRESKDVDIFLRDAQYLTYLTPRLNNAVGNLTGDYVEGSHFLKLKFAEGEVDFIIAPHLTENYYELKRVAGREVRVESPEEIILKKLFYRAETLKTRDVVDVAAAYERRKGRLLECLSFITLRLAAIKYRWEKLKTIYSAEAAGLIMLEPGLINRAPALFEDFLNEAERLYS